MQTPINETHINETHINETHDEERAFYGLRQARLENCTFAGPADGESALKETADLELAGCSFLLRYPLWHTTRATLHNCHMADTCRAALWYDEAVTVTSSRLGGVKALRECRDIRLQDCEIDSTEFGWFCRGLRLANCRLQSEYPFLQSGDLTIQNLQMTAKYSFQYVQNATVTNSVLDTKDAFWHSRNVTVQDSVVKGEYLGWYSENLRLVRCQIIGTQPLCYAHGLVLEDCTLHPSCDLAFEKSDVQANILGPITSVKNPASGSITATSIGELILDAPDTNCKISTNSAAFPA